MHVTILASYQILFLYTECYRLEFYFSVINMQIWEKKIKCNSYVKNDLNMGDRRKWERESDLEVFVLIKEQDLICDLWIFLT